MTSNNLRFRLFETQNPSSIANYPSLSASLMPTVMESNSGKRVARRRKVPWIEERRHQVDQRYPRVTVGALPDDVLLEIFDFYLVGFYLDAWHTLVHVCKRWRCIVFASSHRLQLQLLCTNKRPVQSTLDIWPGLPIVISGRRGMSKLQEANNIIAALRQHNRVREINIDDIPNAFLKRIQKMKMRNPFSALTSLRLHHSWQNRTNFPVLPESFLGGSAPRLREIYLDGIPFPALTKLLLSTHDLVKLELWDIPLSGYISPEALVTCLSTSTLLEKFTLGFRSPRSHVNRGKRLLPRPTRVVLPALTKIWFHGDSEYLEDIVSQIDTPLLDWFHITFFNQLVFDTPLLRHFISRIDTFKAPHRANIGFRNSEVALSLYRMDDHHILWSQISCRPPDWQLSSLAQFCTSALSPVPSLERLHINDYGQHWEDDIENGQWLELLRPFTSMKDLFLYEKLFGLVAPALEELAGERVTEVLPALQNLFLEGPQPSDPVKKAIGEFIAARQLSGCPVTVHHRLRELGNWQPLHWEMADDK